MNTFTPAHSYTGTKTQLITGFIKANQRFFQGSSVYQIHLAVPLDENLISDGNLYSLKSLMRSIVNGKQTIDGIDNRDWFASHFLGGFYKVNIKSVIA
jgi:hypothetical protein